MLVTLTIVDRNLYEAERMLTMPKYFSDVQIFLAMSKFRGELKFSYILKERQNIEILNLNSPSK